MTLRGHAWVVTASASLVGIVLDLAPAAVPTISVTAEKKREATASIEAHKDQLIALSRRIWEFAETALREHQSSNVLARAAEEHGFSVERGVAGMPTAFVATFGAGRPLIGILGEYDALPGLSQKASTSKEPRVPGAPGHGCGHNLFGPASLGAAIAIKELIEKEKLTGTIRFYGTPAEESVGGKIYMARDGLFDDLDVCLAWHPSDKTRADTTSSQALVDFVVDFRGKTAHAAYDPWNGRSAVDALELCTHGLNLMREHVRPSVRIHYAIVDGGQVPNVVPDHARLWCWVRDWQRTEVDSVLTRVRKVVEGAALMAGVESRLKVQSGDYEMLVNHTGAEVIHDNLTWLGPLDFSEEEQQFARALQRAVEIPEKGLNGEVRPLEGQIAEGGSSDVGDVSWVVPTLHLSVTCAPEGSPWHAWPVVAASGMSIGEKGLVYAAKALATTMVDLYEDADKRSAIRAEFDGQTKGHTFQPYIPPGPPPLPEK